MSYSPYGDVDGSVFMKPKQIEMDGILERIYDSLTTNEGERTLMVVCGDHGMNDVQPFSLMSDGRPAIMADHPLERHPRYIPHNRVSSQAVLFMSPSFPENTSAVPCPTESRSEFQYYDKIQQSDLVPTISTLLGWTIPRNNIGVILRSVISLWQGTILNKLLK